MEIGTVVLCQIEIKPDNEEAVIVLGTFGIITDKWGNDGYEVRFADHKEPLSISAKDITPLGNDNWNDVVLRQEYEIRQLTRERADLQEQLETAQDEIKILQGRLAGYINRGR